MQGDIKCLAFKFPGMELSPMANINYAVTFEKYKGEMAPNIISLRNIIRVRIL